MKKNQPPQTKTTDAVIWQPTEELFWATDGGWTGKLSEARLFASAEAALEFSRRYPSMQEYQVIVGLGTKDEEIIPVVDGRFEVMPATSTAVTVAGREAAIEQQFTAAKNFLHMSKLSMAQSVGYMILLGFELKRLKKELGETRGRKAAGEISSNIGTYFELVEKVLGISKTAAWRFEQMADGAKKRLKDVKLESLVAVPLAELPAAQQDQLIGAVSKATDGKTAQQIMLDWGITKKPKNAKGGHRPGENDGKEPTTDEAIALAQKLAREDWAYAQEQFLSGYGVKFTILDDAEIEAQASYLELALKLRRDWLKSPKKQRNAEHLEEALQEALAPATPEA